MLKLEVVVGVVVGVVVVRVETKVAEGYRLQLQK